MNSDCRKYGFIDLQDVAYPIWFGQQHPLHAQPSRVCFQPATARHGNVSWVRGHHRKHLPPQNAALITGHDANCGSLARHASRPLLVEVINARSLWAWDQQKHNGHSMNEP
jgi:hypothetical protein